MTTHRINIENTGDTILCPDDVPVLTAMITLGRRGIPVGCRGGGCGVCKVQMTGGDYRCRKMSRAHVSFVEEAKGFALACQVVPKSTLTLRVAGPLRNNILRSKNQALANYWRSAVRERTKCGGAT